MKKKYLILVVFALLSLIGWSQEIPQNHLQLWLRADSVALENGKVSQWYDLSSNQYSILQTGEANRPQKVNNALNGNPVVRFDGINDYLDGGDILDYNTESHTVFLIAKSTNTSWGTFYAKSLSGVANSRYALLYNGGNHIIKNIYVDNRNKSYASTPSLGLDYMFLKLENDRSESLNSLFINNSLDASRVINSAYDMNSDFNFLIGAYNNNSGGTPPVAGFRLKGDIAELIIFDTILDDFQNQQVLDYLRDKYSQPVSLGEDIDISYGFCDTTLTTNQTFNKYLWSTGDTTTSISVNQTGYYSVTTTDRFGFKSTDSVYVQFPVIELKDSTICLGDSVLYAIDLSNYSYLWSDNSVQSSKWISEEGNYSVELTDTNFCTYVVDFSVEVDSFSSNVSLGNDTSLCAGNRIQLIEGEELCNSFLWFSGETTSFKEIYDSGWQILTMENAFGCQAKDSIYVNIQGTAPDPMYATENLCWGDTTVFIDVSTSEEDIIEKLWLINGEDTLLGDTVRYKFDNVGSYDVSQVVTAQSGCSNRLDFQIEIKPTANVNFELFSICKNIEMELVPHQEIPEGSLVQGYAWVLDNMIISDNDTLVYTFENEGEFDLKCQLTLDNGCMSSYEKKVNVSSSYPLPERLSLVSPNNYFNVPNNIDSINFVWNVDSLSLKYVFQISNTPDFSNVLLEKVCLDNHYFTNINFQEDTLFWRVISYNPCLEPFYSDVYQLKQVPLSILDKCALWLRADSVALENGKVSQWYDLSPNHHPILQAEETSRPQRVDNALNGKPVIRFDGINDYLDGGDILDYHKASHTVFLIAKSTNTSWGTFYAKSLSGAVNNRYALLYNGDNHIIKNIYVDNWDKSYISTPSLGYMFLKLENNRGESLNSLFINNSLDASGEINSGYDMNSDFNFLIGAYNNNVGGVPPITGFCLKGDIAELIIFDTILGNVQNQQVLDYLRDKYTQPVSLGYDVNIPYGFCNTTLVTNHSFKTYLWNTGETTSSISVNRTGYYSVTTTDIFGFESTDSIWVKVPQVNRPLLDTNVVCFGDTLTWNTQLSNNYQFEWSGGTSDSLLKITQAGNYYVTITDNLGCQFESEPIRVEIDNYPNSISLGNDTALCKGEPLGLLAGKDSTVNYWWSDGSTGEVVTVQESGEYSVITENAIGCKAKDTINVQIRGIAPTPDFTVEHLCLNDTTLFIDVSTNEDNSDITQWLWKVGDEDEFTNAFFKYQFPDTGNYNVKLEVINANNCKNEIAKTVRIYSLPTVDWYHSINCQGYEVTFENRSQNAMGDINFAYWDLGNNDTVSASFIQKIYHTPGKYPINLKVGTADGCFSQKSGFINIKPSPIADFDYSAVCKGKNVVFYDNTQVYGVLKNISWDWTLSDGQTSDLKNPDFIFTENKEYDVQLVCTSINGCQDTISKSIWVYNNPKAEFKIDTSCVFSNLPVRNLSQETQAEGHPSQIERYYWYLDGNSIALDKNFNYMLSQAGSHLLKLKVESSSGCSDVSSQWFETYPIPSSAFVVSEHYATPGEPIVCEVEAPVDSNVYLFSFGDNTVISDTLVNHQYEMPDDYIVKLIAENTYTCKDSSLQYIKVVKPLLDLSLEQIETIDDNGRTLVKLGLANIGNIDITDITFRLNLNEGTTFEEDYQLDLRIGDYKEVVLDSKFLFSVDESHFLCVDANVNTRFNDVNLENNHICFGNIKEDKVLKLYPNPADDNIKLWYNSLEKKTTELAVYTTNGEKLIEKKVTLHPQINIIDLTVGGLASGYYILRIDKNPISFIVK